MATLPSRSTGRAWLSVILLFLVWRGALFAVSFLGQNMTAPRAGGNPYKFFQAYPDDHHFLDGWVRWDSGWHGKVAERGYYVEGGQSDVSFFPAFPYAARVLGKVVGSHWTAGLLLANAGLLAALLFLQRIALLLYDESRAQAALRACSRSRGRSSRPRTWPRVCSSVSPSPAPTSTCGGAPGWRDRWACWRP